MEERSSGNSINNRDDLESTCDQNAEDVKESLSRSTFDFSEKSWKTDLTLIVDGTRLYVSKFILAIASPVFQTMFQGSFREKMESELKLPGKNVEDVVEFLRCIYPDTVARVTFQNALQILPLVEEYQVLQLKPRCEKVLIEGIDQSTSTENLFILMKEAVLYDMSALINQCIYFASAKSEEELKEAEMKFPVPAEHMRDIYKGSAARLRDEVRELKTDIEGLKNEVSELEETKTKFDEQLKNYETWIRSEMSCMNTSADIQLDEKLSWSGRTLLLELKNISYSRPAVEKIFFVWYTKFNIEITKMYSEINATVKSLEEGLSACTVEIQFVVVNRIRTEKSLSVNYRFEMSKTNKREHCKLVDVNVIGEKNGFVLNDNLQVIVNIFVSKPVLCTDPK